MSKNFPANFKNRKARMQFSKTYQEKLEEFQITLPWTDQRSTFIKAMERGNSQEKRELLMTQSI